MWKEGKKAYPGWAAVSLVKWALPGTGPSSLQADTHSWWPGRMGHRDAAACYQSTQKDTKKRTVTWLRCAHPPAHHLGKEAET